MCALPLLLYSEVAGYQETLRAGTWEWVKMPTINEASLNQAQKALMISHNRILSLCNQLLVRSRQGAARSNEVITRPGLLSIPINASNVQNIRYCIFGEDECTEVPFSECSICGCNCCSLHGPEHDKHSSWTTEESIANHKRVLQELRRVPQRVPAARGRGRGASTNALAITRAVPNLIAAVSTNGSDGVIDYDESSSVTVGGDRAGVLPSDGTVATPVVVAAATSSGTGPAGVASSVGAAPNRVVVVSARSSAGRRSSQGARAVQIRRSASSSVLPAGPAPTPMRVETSADSRSGAGGNNEEGRHIGANNEVVVDTAVAGSNPSNRGGLLPVSSLRVNELKDILRGVYGVTEGQMANETGKYLKLLLQNKRLEAGPNARAMEAVIG